MATIPKTSYTSNGCLYRDCLNIALRHHDFDDREPLNLSRLIGIIHDYESQIYAIANLLEREPDIELAGFTFIDYFANYFCS